MRVKNLTPFLFGAKVTSRSPPTPEMTLIVRAAFVLAPGQPLRLPEGPYPLSQGSLRADVFRDDDEERTGEVLYPGDFADFKPAAEVLLRGTCHAPRGRPVVECPVRFSVGKWSKTLRVVGPRVFDRAGVPSEPGAFTSLPLGYGNSFGGPEYMENPVGKGLSGDEVPNIEDPLSPLRSRRDRPRPAGFGPLSPSWPSRAGKLGKMYGGAYSRTRAPFYAEDFDWTHFLAAPPDQWLPGYLRGDEPVSFTHLHPKATTFEVTLPGHRIRALVRTRDGRAGAAAMSLDTLFADVDGERLYLTYRGLYTVAERDLSDVTAVLVASEPLAEAPRPDADYEALLAAFERDPAGVEESVPVAHRELWRGFSQKDGPPRPPPVQGADPLSDLLGGELRGVAKPEQAAIRDIVSAALGMRVPPGTDLAGKLAAGVAARAAGAPGPLPVSPGGAPPVALAGVLRSLREAAAKARESAAASGRPTGDLDKVDALLADPRLKKLDPSIGGAEPPAPGPGADFSGQDLRGRDLSDLLLQGANFTDALLSGAKLVRASLVGARFTRAVLAEADLEGADLTGADLTSANLLKCRAPGAIFLRATLDRAHLGEADLADADLSEVRGEQAFFEKASLGRARFRGARLSSCSFDDAALEQALFTKAELVACRFLGAAARGLGLEGASLERTTFAGADLTNARILDATGTGSIWVSALLDGATFRGSRLPGAHFSEARGQRTRLGYCDLRGARFYRAVLPGVELTGSNLMNADLCHADLTRGRLDGANLYGAKLTLARTDGCDLTGANLKRSTLEGP